MAAIICVFVISLAGRFFTSMHSGTAASMSLAPDASIRPRRKVRLTAIRAVSPKRWAR